MTAPRVPPSRTEFLCNHSWIRLVQTPATRRARRVQDPLCQTLCNPRARSNLGLPYETIGTRVTKATHRCYDGHTGRPGVGTRWEQKSKNKQGTVFFGSRHEHELSPQVRGDYNNCTITDLISYTKIKRLRGYLADMQNVSRSKDEGCVRGKLATGILQEEAGGRRVGQLTNPFNFLPLVWQDRFRGLFEPTEKLERTTTVTVL